MSERTPADVPYTTEQTERGTRITLHPGRLVFCDACCKDYTDSTASGGLLHGSWAICPECVPRFANSRHNRAFCPPHLSFADWIRSGRG